MKNGTQDWISTYPLYFICLLLFFKSFSYVWIVNLFIVWLFYKTIWFTSAHFFSAFQIRRFYKEFFGKEQDFKLEVVDKANFNIDIIKEFSWFVLNKNFLTKGLGNKSTKALKFFNVPILVFYAQPVGNKLLSSCKAYMYTGGMFILICRAKRIDSNPFEEFLFYHELEHLNDNGLMNYRRSMQHKMRVILHLFFFIICLISFKTITAFILFLIFHFIYFLFDYTAQRECIADIWALLKLKDNKKRNFVLKILRQALAIHQKDKKFFRRYVSNRRLNNLDIFNDLLESDMSPSDEASIKHLNNFNYRSFDLLTFLVTCYVFYIIYSLSVSALVFLKATLFLYIIYCLSFLLITIFASFVCILLNKRFEILFQNGSYYQPFNMIENYNYIDMESLIKAKFDSTK